MEYSTHHTPHSTTQIESYNEYIVTRIYSSFRLDMTALFWQLSLKFVAPMLAERYIGLDDEQTRKRTWPGCNESTWCAVWGEITISHLSSVSVGLRHIVMTTERITHKYSDTSLPSSTLNPGPTLALSPGLCFVVLFCFQNVKDLGSFPHLD